LCGLYVYSVRAWAMDASEQELCVCGLAADLPMLAYVKELPVLGPPKTQVTGIYTCARWLLYRCDSVFMIKY
jgi:hypothetical protein